jgi:6,7-dimethyl-8-ribityllumazine synthase
MTQKGLCIGVVTAQFNSIVTDRLRDGALAFLKRQKSVRVLSTEVPGSFELPLAAQWMFECHHADAVVCLGAVIRGSTQHFDYVCSTTSSGLMNVQLKWGRPVGFGVLTCDSLEQAFDRAGGKLGNKGIESAAVVLEMLRVKSELPAGGVSEVAGEEGRPC